ATLLLTENLFNRTGVMCLIPITQTTTHWWCLHETTLFPPWTFSDPPNGSSSFRINRVLDGQTEKRRGFENEGGV
ncbi:MAG: hypothetical protein PVJ98_05520, partial [Akkermansiaceae bacterium]